MVAVAATATAPQQAQAPPLPPAAAAPSLLLAFLHAIGGQLLQLCASLANAKYGSWLAKWICAHFPACVSQVQHTVGSTGKGCPPKLGAFLNLLPLHAELILHKLYIGSSQS